MHLMLRILMKVTIKTLEYITILYLQKVYLFSEVPDLTSKTMSFAFWVRGHVEM